MGVIIRRENLDRAMHPGMVMLRNTEKSQLEMKWRDLDCILPSAFQRKQPWILLPASGSVKEISVASCCIP